MISVINIVDGGDQEFFLTPDNRFIRLSHNGPEEPQKFKTVKSVMKRLDQLRPRYPPVCSIYALEIKEFEARRKIVQKESATRNGLITEVSGASDELTNG